MRWGLLATTITAMLAAGCASEPQLSRHSAAFVPPRVAPVVATRAATASAVAPVTSVATNSAAIASTTNATSSLASIASRLLKPGDRIEVQLRAIPQPDSLRMVVDETGGINLPYLGLINVTGCSSSEAGRLIEKAYIDGQIYRVISVCVMPPEQEYSVTGEVVRPGPYPLNRDLSFMQALARAGRYTDFADPSSVKIIRGDKIISINARHIEEGRDKDVTIVPGDIISVPKRWY